MTSSPENFIAIIAWLAGACFCGVLPLGFAAILFFTSRKRGQIGSAVGAAKKTTVAALQAGPGLVRLEGHIAQVPQALDGPAEAALAYVRLKVEIYESNTDGDGASWKGLTDKTRCVPFRLEDGSGAVWVNPEGLDKQLLGEGVIPNDDQIQAAIILLGISSNMLRGRLRFRLWELRGSQAVTVVGSAAQGQAGLEIVRAQGQPFVVSTLLGTQVDGTITSQTNKAKTWMLVLGIPGALMLLCGLGGALVALIRVLLAK